MIGITSNIYSWSRQSSSITKKNGFWIWCCDWSASDKSIEETFILIGLIQCKDSRKVASALFAMPNLFIMSDNKSARGLASYFFYWSKHFMAGKCILKPLKNVRLSLSKYNNCVHQALSTLFDNILRYMRLIVLVFVGKLYQIVPNGPEQLFPIFWQRVL